MNTKYITDERREKVYKAVIKLWKANLRSPSIREIVEECREPGFASIHIVHGCIKDLATAKILTIVRGKVYPYGLDVAVKRTVKLFMDRV